MHMSLHMSIHMPAHMPAHMSIHMSYTHVDRFAVEISQAMNRHLWTGDHYATQVSQSQY